jgi:hypothetical protein
LASRSEWRARARGARTRARGVGGAAGERGGGKRPIASLICLFNLSSPPLSARRLVVQAIIEDEKVGLDQLEEALNAFTEIIQSVDFCSMSKVSGR